MFADDFTKQWLLAWNNHDLEQVLSHYNAAAEMSSPKIASVMKEESGTLKGKSRIRKYWQRALTLTPGLHFKHIATFIGSDSLAIHYENTKTTAVEVFFFDEDGLIIKAAANYG